MATRGTKIGILIAAVVVAAVLVWGVVLGVLGFILSQAGQAAAPVTKPVPSASASMSVDPSLARFYDQHIQWTACGSAECGTVTVPLDYANPEGDTIELSVTRVASNGGGRLGSLFVNPGGPGGSAVDYAQAADYVVTDQIRQAYDIVGVDPRGVGRSTPVHCLTDRQLDDLVAIDGTPDTPAETQALIDMAPVPGQGCAAKGNPIFAHMGTEDTARDLDIVRAAVGDPVLNYLGKSYGSLIGQVYAQLFPSNVGRMVIDGILPAELDNVSITEGQALSFEEAFADFAADCATHSDCPFEGSGAQVADALRSWISGLDSKPIPVGKREVNEAIAAYAVASYLYFPSYDYPQLRSALSEAVKKQDGAPLIDLLDQRISRGPDGKYTDNSNDAFYAVTCLDRPYTGTVDDVKALAQAWRESAPTFGEGLAWGLLTCKDWPASTAERITNVTAPGAPPILVVSTMHDPATPYAWGVQVAQTLEKATLLTYDAHGHTAYTEGSDCIDRNVDAFLLRGTMPTAGTICS